MLVAPLVTFLASASPNQAVMLVAPLVNVSSECFPEPSSDVGGPSSQRF